MFQGKTRRHGANYTSVKLVSCGTHEQNTAMLWLTLSSATRRARAAADTRRTRDDLAALPKRLAVEGSAISLQLSCAVFAGD